MVSIFHRNFQKVINANVVFIRSFRSKSSEKTGSPLRYFRLNLTDSGRKEDLFLGQSCWSRSVKKVIHSEKYFLLEERKWNK